MGFAWSLFLAQSGAEHQCEQVAELGSARLMNDRSAPFLIWLPSGLFKQLFYFVYVDNLFDLGTERLDVGVAMDAIVKRFSGKGLVTHEREDSGGTIVTLGVVIDCEAHRTVSSPKRWWRVRTMVDAVVGRRRASGRVLEVLLGHMTFVALLRRQLLGIFFTIYRFIDAHYDRPAPIWQSVLDELIAFSGAMVFLESSWDLPWCDFVVASDASEAGWGLSSARWPIDQVEAVGRVKERDRFRIRGGCGARASAFAAAGVEPSAEGEAGWVPVAGGPWERDTLFPEVPATLLGSDLWTAIASGPWTFTEDISRLESRALLFGLERSVLNTHGGECRVLLLGDNLGVVLAFGRCRSKDFVLLSLIRRFCAIILARGLHVAVRWVPSEFNSADEPSRIYGGEVSKSLTHVLNTVVPDAFCQDGAEENSSKHMLDTRELEVDPDPFLGASRGPGPLPSAVALPSVVPRGAPRPVGPVRGLSVEGPPPAHEIRTTIPMEISKPDQTFFSQCTSTHVQI